MTGFDIAIASKALAPVVQSVVAGGKSLGKEYFKKWSALNFSSKLAKKIHKIESVKTLWQFEKDVKIRDFYYPSSIIVSPGHTEKVDCISDLKSMHTVIEGIVGQGKSIFLRYLCAQELTEKNCGKIPIFIELRALKGSRTLTQLICEALAAYDLPSDEVIFGYLARSGKLVLLLDAYDEIDTAITANVTQELSRLCEVYEEMAVIVTARPDCDVQKLSVFSVVKLAPISKDDRHPFLTRLGLSAVRASEIVAAIDNSSQEISQLVTTPLMLTLTVTVYRSEKMIPPGLAEFFEQLFLTVFSRHDKTKPGFERKHHTGLSERVLQKFFETFCFSCAKDGLTRTLTSEQFASMFERAADHFTEGKCTLENFKKDMCNVACLLLEDGFGEITFLHKSIAEFFAASFIRHTKESSVENFYQKAATQRNKWQAILSFLSNIDKYRYFTYYLLPMNRAFLQAVEPHGIETSDAHIASWIDTWYADTEASIAFAEPESTSSEISFQASPNSASESERHRDARDRIYHTLASRIAVDSTPLESVPRITEDRFIKHLREHRIQSVHRLTNMRFGSPTTRSYINASIPFLVSRYGHAGFVSELRRMCARIRYDTDKIERDIIEDNRRDELI